MNFFQNDIQSKGPKRPLGTKKNKGWIEDNTIFLTPNDLFSPVMFDVPMELTENERVWATPILSNTPKYSFDALGEIETNYIIPTNSSISNFWASHPAN